MSPYRLYLVTDDQQDITTLLKVVKEGVAGGVTMVQVREKGDNIQAFIERAQAVKNLLRGTNIALIINDRIDVALAVDADGVHLGQSDMPVNIARKLIGPNKLLGLSIENEQQLIAANMLPLDYIGLSAIFSTPTKTNIKKQWGIHGLKNALSKTNFPVVAIGGINQHNLDSIIHTGVQGIAIVSAICHASSPKKAASNLLKQIQAASPK